MQEPPDVSFGPFRLDVVNERVWRGKRKIVLRPKTFAVLRHLITHAGRLVRKEEIINAIWSEATVSDGVLIVCIGELREALGDRGKTPRFIETVSRRGYRF